MEVGGKRELPSEHQSRTCAFLADALIYGSRREARTSLRTPIEENPSQWLPPTIPPSAPTPTREPLLVRSGGGGPGYLTGPGPPARPIPQPRPAHRARLGVHRRQPRGHARAPRRTCWPASPLFPSSPGALSLRDGPISSPDSNLGTAGDGELAEIQHGGRVAALGRSFRMRSSMDGYFSAWRFIQAMPHE